MNGEVAAPASAIDRSARAELIHSSAIAAPMLRLWQAALGETADTRMPSRLRAVFSPPSVTVPKVAREGAAPAEQVRTPAPPPTRLTETALSPALASAARRTGLPQEALAAIVNAEAARRKDGSLDPASRNPRSSAVGLTQFLAGSWIAEAERKGTYLNRLARGNDWLNSLGQVRVEARRALLALRLDAGTAIEAAADYAKHNLTVLEKAGVEVGQNVARVTRLAYLAHHLGAGDAARYLTKGLDGARAAALLAAQVGTQAAAKRIEALGDAAAAHRGWLERFIAKKISFTGLGD